MRRQGLRPKSNSPTSGGIPCVALSVSLALLLSCSSHGGQPPLPPKQPVGGGKPPIAPPSPPPITPPLGGGVLHPASVTLDGPTPYIFPVYPDEGAFVTEGGLSPLNVQVQIQDKLSVGISSVYFALDLKVATPTYDPGTGIASYSVTGLLPGKHLLNVLARDNLGNQYERGWAFNTDPAPPIITDVSFDATTGNVQEMYSAMYVTFQGDLNPATVGNPAYWQVLDALNVPVATVTSVDLIRNIHRARLNLTPSVYLRSKFQLVIAYGEGEQRGYYGYKLSEVPGQGFGLGSGFAGGGLVGGDTGGIIGGGEGFGPAWNDYLWPLTPISSCLCTPHDPICDEPTAPTGVHFGGYLLAVDGGQPGPDPQPPPDSLLYWWEHLDPNATRDANWWCSHFRIGLNYQPGWQENYILNEDVAEYDKDMTHDVSWNGTGTHWGYHPGPPQTGDAAKWHQWPSYPCPHPDPVLSQWNLSDVKWGWPPAEIYPQTPDWGKGEPFTWFSRYYGEGQYCGVANQEFVQVTEAHADNLSPEFVAPYPKIISALERLNFKQDYAAGGIIVGEDPYVLDYNSNPAAHAGDRFIAVVGRDPNGPRTLLMATPAPIYNNGEFASNIGAASYACGDRAYLSEIDPTYTPPIDCSNKGHRNIDRLICTGVGTEEDWNHTCDWGVVSATYMIDEPEYAVNPGNPPTQKDCRLWPPGTGNNLDPDCSALFERAVWFIKLDNVKRDSPNVDFEKLHYFVRLDDNQGSWRISGELDPNDCEGGQLKAQAPGGSVPHNCVELLRPGASQNKQYVNLEKDQAGEDECNQYEQPAPPAPKSPRLPEENGTDTCVVAFVHQRVRNRVTQIRFSFEDIAYDPPEPNTDPTNPGVDCDFRQDPCAGFLNVPNDNRGAGPVGFACVIGYTCGDPLCTVQVPCPVLVVDVRGSDHKAAAIFVTSRYGGDNYNLQARAVGPQPGQGDCPLHDNRVLTVWRKVYAYADRMQAGHTDEPDTTRVQAVMNDAFIYFDFKPWAYTDHANWLRQGDAQALCDLGTATGEQYPESVGVVRFVHDKFPARYPPPYGTNHPPPPKDSVQGFGAHIIASASSGQPGSGYSGKQFGLQCEVTSPYQDPQHAFIAAETIAQARDDPWMDPDDNIVELCASLGILLPGQCVGVAELAWKTMVHEYGHTVGLDDDTLTHCDQIPGGIEGENSSVMIYGCLEHVNFDGYFSRANILQLRQPGRFDSD